MLRGHGPEKFAIAFGYVAGTVLWVLLAGPGHLTPARGIVMLGASVLTLGAVVRALHLPPAVAGRPAQTARRLPGKRPSTLGVWVAYGAGVVSWAATALTGRSPSAALLLGMASGLVWTTLAVALALILPGSDRGQPS